MKNLRKYIAAMLVSLFCIGLFPLDVMASSQKNSTVEKQVIPLEKVDLEGSAAYEKFAEDFRLHTNDSEIQLPSQRVKDLKDNIVNDVSLQEKQIVELTEEEFNDTIEYADVIGNPISTLNSYNAYGLIDDIYDVDFFRFSLPTRGAISAVGLWLGNYYNNGWEDDLYIVIADVNGNILYGCEFYQFDDGTATRYWEGILDPGVYYIGVAANDAYGSTYVGEIYGFGLQYDYAEKPSYAVSYESNGGTFIPLITVQEGDLITKPNNPVKNGYTFVGWYKDSSFINPWNFNIDTVTYNITLYAKWAINSYVVNFVPNGGPTISNQTITYDSYVNEPQVPTRAGYNFAGWYANKELTVPWNFYSDRVTKATTLYAKWNPIPYEVRFETFGGTVIPTRTQNYDTLVVKPSDPVLSGYHFGGWYLESSYQTVFDFNTMKVKGNLVLYAKWVSQSLYDVVAGANRYYTAAEISKKTYEDADTVILASGENYPDALAGGPLAYLLNAPILLTQQNRIPKGTLDEIIRLGASKVIILGSDVAVSEGVAQILTDMGIQVERVAGSSRYITAVEVAKRVQAASVIKHKAVIASGMDFADALSAGSYASMEGIPILLTRSDRLMSSLSEALQDLGITEVVLIGGSSAVNPSVEDAIRALGIQVTRYFGDNRYLTSIVIAQNFYQDSTEAIIANGMNFPDALAAVPMAAKMKAPIILAGNGRISASVLSYIGASNLTHVRFVGGETMVPLSVRTQVAEALQ